MTGNLLCFRVNNQLVTHAAICSLTMEESTGARFSILHNYLQSRKCSPVIHFEGPVSITGTMGGRSLWKAKCSLQGLEFESEGRTKMECKVLIYQQIRDSAEAHDSGEVVRTLELHPPQSRAPRRGSRGEAAKERQSARFVEKIKMFKDFIFKTCVCGRKNFIKYSKCIACGNDLDKVLRKQKAKVFLDIEREKGDQEAPPISIGVVVMSEGGDVAMKEEIFILPDGEHPSKTCREDRYAIKLHKMFLGVRKGKKVLLTVREGQQVVLPTVSPKQGAEMLTAFLESVGKQCDIFFHGQDDLCLIPFLQRSMMDERFFSCVDSLNNSQDFYKQVQQSQDPPRKFGMRTVVEDWATEEMKKVYSKGAHSAVVDAEVLGRISCGERLGQRFADFYW